MDNKKYIEIDIVFLFKKIWSKKIIILAVSLLLTALSVVYSIFIVKPMYQSTTKIFTVNNNNDKKALTVQDFQLGNSLVKDYQEIILSKDVLNTVISKENLNVTPDSLANQISVAAPKETRIIAITVSNTDPNKAKQLADTVREVSSNKIKEITKIQDITTIEEAQVPTIPFSPNIKKNALVAFAVGFILSIGIIFLKEILNDKVKRPEDVEETMNLVLLGIIPDSKKG